MMALLAAAALAGDPGPILDDRAYRFCHEPGVDAATAKEWCPVLASLPPEACPGLRATCAGAEGPESGCNQESGGAAGNQLQGGAERELTPPDLGCDPDLSGLEALLKWGVALIVAGIILVIARILLGWFGLKPPTAPSRPIPMVEAPPADADEVPDRPSADLLAAARAALDAGRPGESVWLARGAALRRLAERGRLVLHRARTDREYGRQVRSDPAVHGDLREVLRGAEAHRWGGVPVDAALARAVLAAAERLMTLGLLLAFALASSDAAASDRFAPDGDAGLYEALSRADYDVRWRKEPLAKIGPETGILVLDLGWVLPAEEDWTALRAWVEQGGVLVVTGEPTGFPELGAWQERDEDAALSTSGWLADVGLAAPRLPRPVGRWIGEADVLVADPDGAGVLVEAPVGAGVVVGLTDDRLLQNGALLLPENRAFVAELLQLGQGVGGWPVDAPIEVELATRAFAQSGGGGGQGCPGAETLGEGRLLALVLQSLALWTLVGLWRGWPFGVPRDPPPLARAAFADHVEALARRLWTSKDGRAWADRAVAALWWSRLGSAGLQSAALRAGWSAADARDFAARVERVVDGEPDPRTVEALWRLMR